MKLNSNILLSFCFLLLHQVLFSQNIDSLERKLAITKNDSIKVAIYLEISEICELKDITKYANKALIICERNLKKGLSKPLRSYYLGKKAFAYNNIGYQIHGFGDIPKALYYYKESSKIQKEIGDKKGLSNSLNNIGYTYQNEGNIPKALEYYTKNLDMQREIGDKKGMGISYNNIAMIYKNQGDIPRAIEYMHNSLKVQEAINDKEGIARSYRNIGVIYMEQENISKAQEYLNKSLKSRIEINDKKGIASSYQSLGLLYQKNEPNKALTFFEKALKIQEDVEEMEGIALTLNHIGFIYEKQNKISLALTYFEKSLKIYEVLKAKFGIATCYYHIANTQFIQGKIQEAINNAEKSLTLSKELGYPSIIILPSNLLAKIYAKTGNYKKAFEMKSLFIQMSDSTKNEKNKQLTIQKDYQYGYEKKAIADSLKNIQTHKVFAAQMDYEKTKRMYLYIGIVLIALFAGLIYNRLRISKKQKLIIEFQKTEVDKQRELADQRRELAEEQKLIIQNKQKEILDSIHYASRIQQAMLTSNEYISSHFEASDYFIYYQPKDIVSGDFYWAVEQNGKFYLVTADCTGHGVPGAFMSLLNISFLNENVVERKLGSPAQILNEQRKEIIKALNPNGIENSKDGMDCVLCEFDFSSMKLNFAAANNPLWLVRDHSVTEYKGDKMPVGMHEEFHDFSLHYIDLQKDDIIYTFTDGYADQFGGENGKKFKYKQLQEILLKIHHFPMEEQKYHLAKTFIDWKGENEQVDDILIIGVRI